MNKDLLDLNELAKSTTNQAPISIDGYEDTYLINCLRKMILIRTFENKLADKKKSAEINGPVHLGAGQEAIPVGISSQLCKSEYL